MRFLQNQNLTLGFSQPEVTQWESTPHLSPAVINAIVLLGVLTFALQLCLALFFLLRCWRFEKRVRKALKDPDSVKKLTAPASVHQDIHKRGCYLPCDSAASSPAASAAAEQYEPITNSLFGPSIPWDMVQC